MNADQKLFDQEAFNRGVWIAVEYLVLIRDAPLFAAEICHEAGIGDKAAFKLAKSSGYRTREMNKFIREELVQP